MEKKIIPILSIFIIMITIFCGCQGSQVEQEKNVYFTSDVAKLYNYNIEHIKDVNEKIVEIKVTGDIENTADHILLLRIYAEFYDKNNNYLGESYYEIDSLRVKPNPGYYTSFEITYNQDNAKYVDYVKLRADEYP